MPRARAAAAPALARSLAALLTLAAVGALTLPVRAAAAVPGPPQPAPRALPTIVQDDAELLYRSDDSVRASLAKLQSVGADMVRVTASWSLLTRSPDAAHAPADFDATDPAAYEQGKWFSLDRLVRLANLYGLGVMIDVAFWAPRWAAKDPPDELHRKRGINAAAFARFATAVARRYNGKFVVPGTEPPPPAPPPPDPGLLPGLGLPPPFGPAPVPAAPVVPGPLPLPAVRLLSLWNEPNEPAFIYPQWRRSHGQAVPASPDVYRPMVAAAYPAIKRVEPSDVVLVGGLSPHGSYTGRLIAAVPPLNFLRRLACVDKRLKPVHDGACARFRPVLGDGWSHHPYEREHPPGYHSPPAEGDNAGVGDLGRLTRLLDRLVALGRLSPGLRNVYVTEFGYESNPPDRTVPWTLGDQARFLAWGEYLAQRNRRIKMWSQFELRDGPLKQFNGGPQALAGYGGFQTGLLYEDGRAKPAATAFAAALFVGRRPDGRLLLWGRVRARPGASVIRAEVAPRSSNRWRPMATSAAPGGPAAGGFEPSAGGVFQRYAREASGRLKYRVSYLAGEKWHAGATVLVEPL